MQACELISSTQNAVEEDSAWLRKGYTRKGLLGLAGEQSMGMEMTTPVQVTRRPLRAGRRSIHFASEQTGLMRSYGRPLARSGKKKNRGRSYRARRDRSLGQVMLPLRSRERWISVRAQAFRSQHPQLHAVAYRAPQVVREDRAPARSVSPAHRLLCALLV